MNEPTAPATGRIDAPNEILAEAWRTLRTTASDDRSPHRRNMERSNPESQFQLAYAEAFATALAQKYNCPLLTGDPEFRRVDQLQIDWIGVK